MVLYGWDNVPHRFVMRVPGGSVSQFYMYNRYCDRLIHMVGILIKVFHHVAMGEELWVQSGSME